jgi:hypothetical protein
MSRGSTFKDTQYDRAEGWVAKETRNPSSLVDPEFSLACSCEPKIGSSYPQPVEYF